MSNSPRNIVRKKQQNPHFVAIIILNYIFLFYIKKSRQKCGFSCDIDQYLVVANTNAKTFKNTDNNGVWQFS